MVTIFAVSSGDNFRAKSWSRKFAEDEWFRLSGQEYIQPKAAANCLSAVID
jgi:hypothetical protein